MPQRLSIAAGFVWMTRVSFNRPVLRRCHPRVWPFSRDRTGADEWNQRIHGKELENEKALRA